MNQWGRVAAGLRSNQLSGLPVYCFLTPRLLPHPVEMACALGSAELLRMSVIVSRRGRQGAPPPEPTNMSGQGAEGGLGCGWDYGCDSADSRWGDPPALSRGVQRNHRVLKREERGRKVRTRATAPRHRFSLHHWLWRRTSHECRNMGGPYEL